MSGKTALIAGASGLVGGNLLRLLLDDPQTARVISVGRRKIDSVSSSKLEQIVCTFAELGNVLTQKEIAVDDAYCALGTTIKKAGSQTAFREVDHDYVVAFAQAAQSRGAKRLMLVSAIGADARSSIFYSRVKGETEQAVCSLDFDAVHIFRPGLILGPRAERRTLEALGMAASPFLNQLMLGPARVYRSIEAETIARAMIAAASTDATGRQVHTYDAMKNLAGV